ncbi:MAG: histidine kinase [Clostridiales bacterium]|nr:histidine kinase [Clostridiales bacterium]
MKGKGRRKRIKIQKVLKHIVVCLLFVMLIYILAASITVRYVRTQAENSVVSATKYYSSKLDRTFSDINDYLGEEMFFDQDVILLSYSDDVLARIEAIQNINEKLEFYRTKLGGDFNFFIYYPQEKFFVSSDRGEIELNEYEQIRQEISALVMEDYREAQVKAGKKWRAVFCRGDYYAMNYVYTNEAFACCFIDIEKLIDTLDRVLLEGESIISVISPEGNVYYGEKELQEQGALKASEPAKDLIKTQFNAWEGVVYHSLDYADFGVSILMKSNQQLLFALLLQTAIGILFLCGVIVAIIILYRMKKRIIEPLKEFTNNLSKIQEEEQEVYFENTELLELEEANQLFKKILMQMRQIKIRLYEETLEKQRLQIDYMKLQIQPHFYINCMSLIYNMACMGDDETIQQLSSYVSEYFRYIFRSNPDNVSLTEEIKHVKNYLEIYKIRYRNRLDYDLKTDGKLEDITIPPLLLHTFIENGIKYGKTAGKVLFISLYAQRIRTNGIEFVVLQIEDNGPGFSEEILEELRNGDMVVTDKGTRVGITNCLSRLKMIYDKKARVNFYNKEAGGALVKVVLPIKQGSVDEG